MSPVDDRLNAAGREMRLAFEAMSPRTVSAPGPSRRVLSFAAGVVVVALLVAVPALLRGGGPSDLPLGGPTGSSGPAVVTSAEPAPPTTSPQSPTTVAPAPLQPMCGDELPFSTVLPDDFVGPHDGPSPHSVHDLEDGQIAVHWTGRGGSVELRWPIDSRHRQRRAAIDAATARDDGVSFVLIGQAQHPEVYASNVLDDPATETDFERHCRLAQLVVFGSDGDPWSDFSILEPDSAAPTLRLAPGLPRAGHDRLIVESIEVDVLPAIVPCDGRAEAPILNGTVSDPAVHPTAAGALEEFVEQMETWPKLGYFGLVEPDGSITFGKPFEADPMVAPAPDTGLVVAVFVVPMGEGWAVESWESSGC